VTVQQIWTFTRRWAWLLVVGTMLAALASYVVSSRLPRVYEGSVKLLVTPGQPGNSASNYNDVLAAERLTRTYAEVLRTKPIVDEAARAAGITLSYDKLLPLVAVTPVRDTQLIQVNARANDPDTAASFANQLAAVFIQQTQSSQSSRFSASKDSLGRQVDQLAADIAAHTGDLDRVRAQDPSATRDGELTRLQSELAQLQQSYGTAVRSFEDVRMSEARSSDLLAVVQPASPSPNPVEPRTMLNVALAAIVGLLLSLGSAFLVEYLDDRLSSPERLAQFTGLLSLGSIGSMPKDRRRAGDTNAKAVHDPDKERRRTIDQILQPPPDPEKGHGDYGYGTPNIGEAFRLLRANLQFAAVERPISTLLVTSPDPGDGKSVTAANLAVVMAQAGQRVILVDADLRRPTQHGIFDVPNQAGLTSLLIDELAAPERLLLETRVSGLRFLPSGPLPPNPSELLGSQRMHRRLAELRELADIVILDAPPVLAVSDPAVVAGQTDGTLMVVNAQRTRGQRAGHAAATLRGAGANILGAVLNRVTHRKGSSYYGYYGRAYYSSKTHEASTVRQAA
jgi:polysaccharide biosynthesis transport protein